MYACMLCIIIMFFIGSGILLIIIYIKILLDCDWLISVQLIPNSSAIFCNHRVQFSVITVQFFVITVQFSVMTVQKSITN